MSKAAKKRDCPAVGHSISAAECGSNRVSHYACPAECPYLPFSPANYSQLLELEDKLNPQTMDQLLARAENRPALERALEKARFSPNAHALHACYEWNAFFARGADGRTFAERWADSPTSGLKNDELVLLRAQMQTRVALLEIRRVLDGEQVEAVDLLTPGGPTLRLHDRSLASMAVRFATALAWLYPLPHYWRLSGTAILLPEFGGFEPAEIVTEIVSHLGGPVTEPEMRRWLAENFVRFDESLAAVSRMRRMQMFAGLDAKWGKAVYELQAPFAECVERLEDVFDVQPDSLTPEERKEGFAEARVWTSETPDSKQMAPPGAQTVLGRVLLGQAHWRLEAFGAERLAKLRGQFETQMGDRVRFTGERLDDLGAAMAAKEPSVDKSLVPPRLLEQPEQMLITSSRVLAPPPGVPLAATEAEFRRAAERAFLDDQIPALDNRTPREAARDPALRPRLIRLLKQRVRTHDEHNLETGGNDDINWMLRELGADEISFDPPPLRPPRPRISPTKAETDWEDEWGPAASNLPPAPRLTGGPLSFEEASRRIAEGMDAFATAAEAADELEAMGLTILGDADDLSLDYFDDEEFGFVVPFILQAALALIQPGFSAPATDYDSLERAFKSNMEKLLRHFELEKPDAEGMLSFLADSPQPNLMSVLSAQFLNSAMNAPKKLRPKLQAQPFMLALIKAVVGELDRALRQ
ncbi:MAG: hypothetical protein JWQ04_1500 [Pedosphaera sp.]|nr:hypothetical protein [Pedosphaera sp.]